MEEVNDTVEGVTPPVKTKKEVKKGRSFGSPFKPGDYVVFTAAYNSYDPFAKVKYTPGARYETVIQDENSYIKRLLDTGTLIELSE